VRRGLAPSRERARAAIAAGQVLVGGASADKPSRLVAVDDPVRLVGPPARFVSRGGEKLDAALDRFRVDVAGWRAVDAGASTGGFTDCLLQRDAACVYAVDVGYGQLHPKVRSDPRVTVLERTNVRDLKVADVDGAPVEIVVADLSFISIRTVVPALLGVVGPGGDLVALVKPQFEAGRADVGRGRGVVRDPTVWARVLEEVRDALAALGAAMLGLMVSPLTGAEGNVEFLTHVRAHVGGEPTVDVAAAVAEALTVHGG